jgi:DNA repair exonuclease SbcCD ATPase subunit
VDPEEVTSVIIPAMTEYAIAQNTLNDIANRTRKLSQEDRSIAAALETYAAGTITREELDLCREKDTEWRKAAEDLDRLKESLAGLKSRIAVQQEQLQALEEKRAANLKKEKVLSVFSEVRDLFHKSRIPKHAVTRAVHSINGRMQKLLSSFGQPFTVYFDDDFDLLCDFPEKGRSGCSARNTLSGGQKVAVGIVFHLAKAELLGSSFPIFVLDEPTAFLDTQAKIALVDILNDIRRMAEKGLYFMIPTHDNVLLDCATSVVNLDE